MINVTFTRRAGTREVHIEAWFCGARVYDSLLRLPDDAPNDYFDTLEMRATMADLARPVIDRLREHFTMGIAQPVGDQLREQIYES